MRVAWRLARREVRRRPGRTLLVVLLVAVTVGGITVGDLSYRSHRLAAPSPLGQAAAKLNLSVPQGDERDALELLQDMVPAGAQSVPGHEVFGLPVQRDDNPGLGQQVTLWTVDTGAPLLDGAVVMAEGRQPSADDEVLLSSALAQRLQLRVGDTFQLARPDIDLRVVGIGDSVDRQSLMVAPGYPIDELRQDVVVAVVYTDWRDAYLPAVPMPPGGVGAADTESLVPWVQVPPVPTPTRPGELALLWLASAMVLAVLGIVVAAAFAASGRRQLVTLGQLGAVGADERFARRFLALQGSATALVGSLVGVAGAFVLVAVIGEPVLRHGKWGVAVGDLLVIVATAVAVGTCAALLPTRQLAKAPVLTALAGRAPVAQVRRGQLRLGAIAIVVGLLVLGTAVAATRDASGSGVTAATFLALLAAGTVVAGVCALTPIVVDRWGVLGARSKGSTRLALRSLVRHRARSAAMVAAIAAIGAAGVAGASGVEAWSRFDDSVRFLTRLDVIRVMNQHTMYDESTGIATSTPRPVPQEWLDDVEQVVPGVEWHELAWVDSPTWGQVLLGTDETLAAIGVPAEQRDDLFADGDVVFVARSEFYSGWCTGPDCGFGTDMLLVPDLAFTGVSLVQPNAVDGLGFTPGMQEQLGIAPADLTDAQREQLTVVSYASMYDGYFFNQEVGDGQQLFPGGAGATWEYPYVGPLVTRDMAQGVVLAAVLLLVGLVVTIGLALWAAEGKVERDQLVAVGAGPRSLAGMAGVRAWVLATSGGVIAVPLGMSMLWVVVRAADSNRTPFPTVAAIAIAIGLPLVVAVGAYTASAFAQRVRPVTGATMSLD